MDDVLERINFECYKQMKRRVDSPIHGFPRLNFNKAGNDVAMKDLPTPEGLRVHLGFTFQQNHSNMVVLLA